MSRERFIWDRELQDLIPAGEWHARRRNEKRSDLQAPMLMRDIGEYRSTVTGEMITGRRQHRDHLKAHDCVEIGNEYLPPNPFIPDPVGPDVARAIEQGAPPEMKQALEQAQSVLPVPSVHS